jgi:hypothetical protein
MGQLILCKMQGLAETAGTLDKHKKNGYDTGIAAAAQCFVQATICAWAGAAHYQIRRSLLWLIQITLLEFPAVP